MGSDGKPKAWCTGCFGEYSEACIALGGAADSNIVTNYFLADGDKGPNAGSLPHAKKSQGRPTKRNLCGLKRGMTEFQIECAKGAKCPNHFAMVSVEQQKSLRDHFRKYRLDLTDGTKRRAYEFVMHYVNRAY